MLNVYTSEVHISVTLRNGETALDFISDIDTSTSCVKNV